MRDAMSAVTAAVLLTWAVTQLTASQSSAAPASRQSERVRPRFDEATLLEDTAETSANVAIGDVNGDGHLDIVLAKGRHWPLVDKVLLGDGTGRFPIARDLSSTADRTYSGRLADLDKDGDLDVVISNDRPDPKFVYLNDGSGRFEQASTFGKADWSTRNASVADVDGDGLLDIVVANRNPPGKGANQICLNRGAGRFDEHCIAFSEESATSVTPADVNGDGRIDLVVPHRDRGQGHVYLREGQGALAFRRLPFGPVDAAIRVSEVADIDGDGRLDIVAIDERTGLWLFSQQSSGAFAPGTKMHEAGETPYALAVSDVDGDTRVDVIVGYVEAPSFVLYNDGPDKPLVPVSFGDGKGTVYGFAIGDLNGDGLADIAAARSDAPNVVYFGAIRRKQ